MIQETSKTKDIIEYIMIIAMFYVTGGAFSYTNYSTQIIVFFLTAFFVVWLSGCVKKLLYKTSFTAILLMSILILLVPLFNADGFPSYIAIIMQILIGFFIASYIPSNVFCRKYVNVIVIFASISLIFFAAGNINPSIATRFPVTIGDASVDYYNAFVYVFMQPKGYGQFILSTRNAGICWEPGCYQCFLNIALIFLFERHKKEEVKGFYTQLAILLITLVTTISTTGILLCLLILIFYNKEWAGKNITAKILVFFGCVALLFFVFRYTDFGTTFANKISSEASLSGEGQTFYTRTSLGHIKYMFEDGFWFFGMSFSRFVNMNIPDLWNSVIHSFLCLGVPFTLIQMIGYAKGSKILNSKWIVLFLAMIICATTETLYWRVFFNTIAAYGWIGLRGSNEQECS